MKVMQAAHSSRRGSRMPAEGQFCNYSHRVCMQNRLEGYEFCVKHILEDKDSRFRQCSYVSQNTGKRCPNASPKSDKKIDGYCSEHMVRTALLKQRSVRRQKPRQSAETLLADLAHYTGPEHKRSSASRALEYASSSESEAEAALVDEAWRGDADSDAESIDSEQEDPLKHAGVYTAEEVALITRDKLIRLQSLYIDQFKRLQHLLRERRRRFLSTVRVERQKLGSLGYAKEDAEERVHYDQLQAMKRYHHRYGKEALLQRQSKERRIQVSEGLHYRPPPYPKCIFTPAGGVKCCDRTVPLTKYCQKHILEEPHQVLFRSCSFGDCCEAVPVVTDSCRCALHCRLPDYVHRLPVKRQSSDEEDDEEAADVSVDVTSIETKPIIEQTLDVQPMDLG